MGILDELKDKASDLRAAEAEQAEQEAERDALYRRELRPAMLEAVQYLDELIKHINYVQPERTIHYPLSPDRQTELALQHQRYRLVMDSSEAPRQLDIRVDAHFLETHQFTIDGKGAADKYAHYLDRYGLPYHRQDSIDRLHQVEGATFTLEGPLKLALRLQADPEQGNIQALLKNFARAGVQTHRFSPAQLDDQQLDRMGRLVLHEVDSLVVPRELPDEMKARLRRQLEQKQREEQAHLEQEEPLPEPGFGDRFKEAWEKRKRHLKGLMDSKKR